MTTFLVCTTVAMALAVPASALSQATTAPPAEPSLRSFFHDLAGDVRRLPSNPTGVSVAVGGILASSLSPFDDDLATWQPSGVFDGGGWMGNPGVLAASTLAAYGVGHWWDRDRLRHVSADMLRAQVLSLGLTYGLKYTVRRERPDRSSNDSFPSGHTAQTFASAMVLTRHFGRKAAIPAFGTAAFIALSRINHRRHFLSDVAFGAGLGVGVGWNGARLPAAWTVGPIASASRIGIQFSRERR